MTTNEILKKLEMMADHLNGIALNAKRKEDDLSLSASSRIGQNGIRIGTEYALEQIGILRRQIETPEPKPKRKPEAALYTFNWIGGGQNQVYAFTKREALEIAAKQFSERFKVDVSTLKRVTSKKGQESWFSNLPLMD